MRRVVLQMGVTLDGYVAGPGGAGDWGLPAEHPDVRAWKVASLRKAGTHIMGRVTYEQMAAYWPDATGGRLGRLADRPPRSHRGDSRPQGRARRRDHGPWRRRVRAGAVQARLD